MCWKMAQKVIKNGVMLLIKNNENTISGVDVMITISAIFDNFLRKNWRSSQKPML
jgi:hypothetical protein